MLKTRHWDRLANGGLTFTDIGFGTAPLGNLYHAISDDDAQAILTVAWDGGIRYFDTAPLYGLGLSETPAEQVPSRQTARRIRAVNKSREAAARLRTDRKGRNWEMV